MDETYKMDGLLTCCAWDISVSSRRTYDFPRPFLSDVKIDPHMLKATSCISISTL